MRSRKLAAPAAAPAASPVIKWVGGKSKLLPELRARMPPRFGRYFEPFAGGAALFFATAPVDAVLGDDNQDLIATYRAIASDVDAVIRRLELHRRHHDDAHYYEVRARWNDREVSWSTPERAAAFIYLNKTCFNGLWRVNKAGEHNVPKGDYRNPSIYDADELRDASAHLRGASIDVGDYKLTTSTAQAGDFVYFDPPYDPASKTSNFTAYTKDSFGKKEQAELADYARVLRHGGTYVMLSNNDTPYVRELYHDFYIDTIQVGRAINSKGDKRGKVAEVVITSYERADS